RPEQASFLVTHIETFPTITCQRIIHPGGLAVGLAVPIPSKPCAGLRNEGTKLRIRHDVHPREWSLISRLQVDGILPTIRSKSSQTIEIREFQKRQWIQRLSLDFLCLDLEPRRQFQRFGLQA